MSLDKLPPYSVLLSLVAMYRAHKLHWLDDDTVEAVVLVDGGKTEKALKIDTDHLTALEVRKLVKLYDSDAAGSVLVTSKGRRTAQRVMDYYQLDIV